MTDLDKLIDAVEQGKTLNWADFVLHIGIENARLAVSAQSGSLDAAKALHDSILDSGYHAEIWACCTRPHVRVIYMDKIHDGGEQDTEARSWLLAILKAYRSLK